MMVLERVERGEVYSADPARGVTQGVSISTQLKLSRVPMG